MRILFIENRYATLLWECVASRLQENGHEIFWLVQNPIFSPKIGKIFSIPFPNERDKLKNDSYEWLRNLDRGVRWFGGSGDHWCYYGKKIQKIIEEVKPELIFGEPTEFHELLVIDVARKLNIPYLHPTSCRYPANRFSFYLFDTLEPIYGSNESMADSEMYDLLKKVALREVTPSYMKKRSLSKFSKSMNFFCRSLKVTLGWFNGEIYITPSPLRKIMLEYGYKKNRKKWEKISIKSNEVLNLNQPFVLFPLQMQPEANLDVWGAPWSDQVDLINRLARALEKINVSLVVKPNPKSKYELSKNLIKAITDAKNVYPISHYVDMSSVLPLSELVVTVTGTVLIECIFINKPVAVIGDHEMTRYPGVIRLGSPDDINLVFMRIADNVCDSPYKNGFKLLMQLSKSSYKGEVGDPLSHPEILTKNNIDLLEKGFLDIISKINKSMIFN